MKIDLQVYQKSLLCYPRYSHLQLQNMLEGDYLTEQVDAIKQLSDWSTILGRFGTNKLGEHIFDQELMDGKR